MSSTKTCDCGSEVEMGHMSGRHKGADFGVVHGSCDECGRLWDDIKSEWVVPAPTCPNCGHRSNGFDSQEDDSIARCGNGNCTVHTFFAGGA